MNVGIKCFNRFLFHKKYDSKSLIGQVLFCLNNCQNRTFSSNSQPLKMRFVQYKNIKGGPQRLGVQLSLDGDIVDVSMVNSSIPNNLVEFLKGGQKYLEKAKR